MIKIKLTVKKIKMSNISEIHVECNIIYSPAQSETAGVVQ